jgi:N-methylhydantoinase B/oxoprolinase/acetone carboxylase alpha subunit
VVTPVFLDGGEPSFFVASRGHHADIGGVTPGSMPPFSNDIGDEGVLIDNYKLVEAGVIREQGLLDLLTGGVHPARNPEQNMADLRAQIAANEKGAKELRLMVGQYGRDTVMSYMRFVQDNAEECVRRVITALHDGSFVLALDNGAQIQVAVRVDVHTIAGGSGAGPGFAGTSVVQTHMTNSRLTDPEVLELRYPVRVDSFEIRSGSGGAGLWRGGNGGVRRIRFLEPMTAAILSNGRNSGAFGMAGGGAGALGENRVERADGRVERLGAIGQAEMGEGDVFVISTPGGGGYGVV